jgi:flavin reductase (DIM6/NTAB) family NADH-FMN oxidoreductase RutF
MERRDYDPDELGIALYPLLNSVVVPRPIAWVSTRSADGVDNLAPHSFFTVSSVSPPVVQFTSVGAKDSLRNAEATGEFVVCMATEELADQVNTVGAVTDRRRVPYVEIAGAS